MRQPAVVYWLSKQRILLFCVQKTCLVSIAAIVYNTDGSRRLNLFHTKMQNALRNPSQTTNDLFNRIRLSSIDYAGKTL